MNSTALFHISSYIKHWLSAKPRGGFGVHSPFLYHFATNVLEEQNPYYAYEEIEKLRKSLLNDTSTISTSDYGTGPSCTKMVCDIARHSLKRKKYAQLLFRIALSNKSEDILELGTSLGITTLYFAKSNSNARITTLEGCPKTAAIAKQLFKNAGTTNIETIVGNIDTTLKTALQKYASLDLVFFDANHRKDATINYFKQALPKVHNNTIFIFDDIHHSTEMEEAWEYIKSDKSVRVTVDIYEMGIVFFKKELKREDYKIRF